MPSEWRIWDYFRQHRGKMCDAATHYAFSCYSDVISSMLVGEIKKQINGQFKVMRAEEVTVNWVEQELLTRSLFSIMEEQWTCLIYNAQSLRPDVKAALLQCEFDEMAPRLLLIFSEQDKWWAELSRATGRFTTVALQTPKFFEMEHLLGFMADYYGVSMDMDAQSTLMELVEHHPLSFSLALKKLQAQFPGQLLTSSQVREVIAHGRMDIFGLASKLAKKQYASFFKDILDGPMEPDQLIELFRFLLGHLLKLHDAGYVDKKSRPTRYDKEIKLLAARWKEKEIQEMLNFCLNMLTASKNQKVNLELKIRQAYLATLR